MIPASKKINYLKQPLDYHILYHTYIADDNNHSEYRTSILSYLEKTGLHILCWFEEWESNNIDAFIKIIMNLSNKIKLWAINQTR